jgi:ferrous iron transport protein A
LRRLSEFDLQSGGEPIAAGPVAGVGTALLSSGRKGFAGVIVAVRASDQAGSLGGAEVERRLLEMGFVEDAPVEIVHEGLFGRDPIAIKLADRTVALRRREAGAVLVRPRTAGANADLP